jgi:hypothetical protein
MRRLFDAAGIDVEQWKALTIAALKIDFRAPSLGGHKSRGGVAAGLIVQGIFYTIFGALMARLVWVNRDLFFIGTVLATYVGFIVGTAILLDHNSAITSPDDYGILGFRPVTSRTYFAVKLTNILVYTNGLTTMAVWLPVVAATVRHGPAVGLASALAAYACSTAITLSVVLGYASMLRFVGAETIRRALSYVQMAMSFVVYGGSFAMSSVISARALAGASLPKTFWVLLVPTTWFGSYLELAAGRTSAFEVVPAVLSVAAIVLMTAGLGGRLTLEYSERLGAISTSTMRVRRPSVSGAGRLWFRSGEARAVALLVRSQFRNDLKFRMGVLSIVPLTIIYMAQTFRAGATADQSASTPLTIAVATFPTMLNMQLTRSDSFRAAWIFFVCPTDRMRIVRAAKDVLTMFFLAPYLGFVLVVSAYVKGNLWGEFVHVALLGLLGHLVLQLTILIDPVLPFSTPMTKGRNSTVLFIFTMGVVLVAALVQFLLIGLYSRATAVAAIAAGILGVSVAVDRLTRVRVNRQTRSLEFEG